MTTVVTILIAVLVFGLLIFIHELGHFVTAKLSGVKVNEFALGMGPTLLKFGKGETQYSLRLFPIGGYVSMEGEDTDSEDARAFCNIKVWKKILIVVAGALMNILLGFFILVGLVASDGYMGNTTIKQFNEGATSSQKLQLEDQIYKINGAKVNIDNDIVYTLLRDQDGLADFIVIRNGEKVELKDVPFKTEQLEDGTQTIAIDFKVARIDANFANTIRQSFYWTLSIAKQVWTALIDLVTGHFGLNQMAGPVGVASTIGQASSMGLRPLLLLVVFISVNLGVFNLLPIPALDGGRLIFLLIEAVRGKPVNPKYEGYVHMVGFLLLIILMVVVTFNDIVRIFTGG